MYQGFVGERRTEDEWVTELEQSDALSGHDGSDSPAGSGLPPGAVAGLW